ncbi:hypothetical protein Pfo_013496 [Paulownia fortunei]|nr:hypothetical protein Pfo_013496 [Paulownia fortunei]
MAASNHQVGGPEFLISKERLAELVEINHTDPLQQCGGIENIVSALKTNIDTGIIGDQRDLHFRRKAFGSNLSLQEWSPQKTKHLKQLFVDAFRDTTIILILCCAMLSLAIGIKRNGLEEGLIDGAMIFLAISLVVSFGAIFRFFKARWMIKKSLKHKKFLWVVRNGKAQKIHESDVVVGDIVCLQTGDQVPADGILIDGDSFQLNDGLEKNGSNYSPNPSLFTGANVVKGHCRMLVTSVGENTERSRLIRSIGLIQPNDNHGPKLQFLDAIDQTNSKLEKICLSLSLLLLTVQLVRCFVWKQDEFHNPDPKAVKNKMEDLINESIKLIKKERSKANGLVTMLCILLFAGRDGLPLAVFTSLLYASNKMKSCEAMIQKLPASATIGLVTTLCTGKTTDLVLQHKKMAELWVGFNLIDDVHRQVDNEILDALREGIFFHSSGHGQEDISLLSWARAVLGLNMEFHGDCSVVRYEAPDMGRNLCCLVVKRDNSIGADKVLYVHWKGAPELILFMCTHYHTVDGTRETLDNNKRTSFLQIVDSLVASGGCCFAFAYKREIEDEEKSRTEEQVREEEEGEAAETLKTLEPDLTLLGLVCLKNPYTPEVREAIEDCRKSGVHIKLIVDDDINTARIMALNCGFLRPEDDNGAGAIIEAADFRNSSEDERMNMIGNIHVMANSSPADKLLMVQCLRKKGETVAATASSIRDCPLLKEADVGIFMGDQCAEVSKEDGDILVRNKNFSQIPGIIKLGRRVCKHLEKFILLQLTLEISAFTINFIALAAMSREELSSFQVLWINLMMEVLGALAVAITTVHTQSSDIQWDKSKPVYGSGPVITRTMHRTIAVQSFFQVTIILILGMKGKAIVQVNELALKTMIFNCYAFCQVFMLIPAIDCLFLGIVAIIGILQVPLAEIMAVVAQWEMLDLKQWCICIGIASFSVPLSFAANWIPTTQK